MMYSIDSEGEVIVYFFMIAIFAIIGIVNLFRKMQKEVDVENSSLISVICTITDKRVISKGNLQLKKYYITYETEGGRRKELEINSEDFGLISVGDKGVIKYKFDRFIHFERKNDEVIEVEKSKCIHVVDSGTETQKVLNEVEKEYADLKSMEAIVVDKLFKVEGNMSNKIYYITFKDETGSEIEFEVGEVYYNTLVVGDKGVLNYRENRFQSFKRE